MGIDHKIGGQRLTVGTLMCAALENTMNKKYDFLSTHARKLK